MKNEIVLLNHNDSDAMGCLMAIYEAFPNIKITMFETNYVNILEVTDRMLQYIQRNNIEVLFVTDVSFSGDKELLIELSTYCPKFLWIDHHQYSEGFFDGLDFEYIYNKDKSASLLTYEYFKLQDKIKGPREQRLNTIIKLINAYDIWLKDTPEFLPGFDLNNYSMQYSVESFAQRIYNEDYKLPKNYTTWTENYKLNYKAHMTKLEKKNLLFRSGNITVAFSDDYIPEIVYNEHKEKLVVMVVNSYGLIRFRLNKDNFPDEIKKRIKSQITDVGHLNAFTIKIDKGYDNIMKEIQKYTEIITKELNV
jgi:oligoribonuclease NrnB/cAMP/cGMP phosphodiesterase (DHH superfamily)